MKEKTFEELMHNKFDVLEEYGGFKLSTKQQSAILELLQQVREATIAECLNQFQELKHENEVILDIAHLATDRIKLTEKN